MSRRTINYNSFGDFEGILYKRAINNIQRGLNFDSSKNCGPKYSPKLIKGSYTKKVCFFKRQVYVIQNTNTFSTTRLHRMSLQMQENRPVILPVTSKFKSESGKVQTETHKKWTGACV